MLVRSTSWNLLAVYILNNTYNYCPTIIKYSVSDLQKEARESPRPSAVSLHSRKTNTPGTHHLLQRIYGVALSVLLFEYVNFAQYRLYSTLLYQTLPHLVLPLCITLQLLGTNIYLLLWPTETIGACSLIYTTFCFLNGYTLSENHVHQLSIC